MKVASIDIGTNSMRLLIADYEYDLINRKKIVRVTRMGQGVDKNGFLTPETIERNLSNLKELSEVAKAERSNPIVVIGTSALRDSKNSQEFINRAKLETGLDVEVISGACEARIGFYGVVKGAKEKEKILVLDIGGGSTEFILGSEDQGIIFLKSIDIGALRLTEKFVRHDPVTEKEIAEIDQYCCESIRNIKKIISDENPSKIIGVGGTVTTLSAINQKVEKYDMDKIHNSILTLENINSILVELMNKKLDERRSIIGLDPKRADIITAGTVILASIMSELKFRQISISEYDNLEGALYQKLKM